MPVPASIDLIELLRSYRLLTAEQLAEWEREPIRAPDSRTLARELIRRGWLTPYQANQLFLGRGHELLLGSYVLLERLGQGGMGKVFKARNWKLDRVVALKVIHKERLNCEAVVRRFLREVQATAQLSHPNVIHAYDADAVNDTLFLVMEFVEGTDLAKLVKKQGPLPVAQACRYISQAARGLEHAYQRGLIHRDIKPHNLLLSREGFVKVLDLGLVRLREAAREPGCSMTGSDCVMGTPDYIAPEQARDSHAADTRADLYSLGCTLYFLLSGRVPFPGGSLTEKLLRHNLDEPTPVEKLRPEVPAAVAAMVAKLMAKKPGDRYQTPTEAVAALTALENDLSLPPPVSVPLAIPVNVQGNDEDLDLLDALSREARDARATMDTVKIAPRVDPKKHGRRRRWFLAGIAGLAMLAITAFHLALRGQAQPVDSAQTPRRPLAADRQNRPGPTHRHARPHTIPAPAPHSVHSRVPGPASDPSSR